MKRKTHQRLLLNSLLKKMQEDNMETIEVKLNGLKVNPWKNKNMIVLSKRAL